MSSEGTEQAAVPGGVAARASAPVAVSITTHNREVELVRTLEALRALDPLPAERIVCADGCRDGTAARVRGDFPEVRLLENNPGQGSIRSRDRILRTATAPYVLCLDDDSYPIEPHFLGEVVALMEAHPEIALVTFPQRSDEFPESMTQEGFGPARWVGTYPNSGAVYRRETYLGLAGFPGFFFHAYEEPDYALQCWAAGQRVLFYPHLTIRHHFTSLERNEVRTHHRHASNECLSIVLRAPLWVVPGLAAWRALRQAQYARSRGGDWLRQEPGWWRRAARGLPEAWRARKALPWGAYRHWLGLLGHPPEAEAFAQPFTAGAAADGRDVSGPLQA